MNMKMSVTWNAGASSSVAVAQVSATKKQTKPLPSLDCKDSTMCPYPTLGLWDKKKVPVGVTATAVLNGAYLDEAIGQHTHTVGTRRHYAFGARDSRVIAEHFH